MSWSDYYCKLGGIGTLTLFVPFILVFLVGFTACNAQVASTTPTPIATTSPTLALSPTSTFDPEVPPNTATFSPAATVTLRPTAIPTTAPTEEPIPTTTPFSPLADNAVILSLHIFSPQPVTSGGEVLVEVRLDPQGRAISGVQFDLAYSPAQLQVLGFTPGAALGADPVVIQKISNQPGASLYALARRGATSLPTPDGTVATLKLHVSESVSPDTPVQVSLQRVKIANENFQRLFQVAVAPPLKLVITAP